MGPIMDYGTKPVALPSNAELYTLLIRCLPGAVILLYDQDLRYIKVEGTGLKESGLSRNDFEGRTLFEVFPPEVARHCESHYRASLMGKCSSHDVELLGRRYLVHNTPIQDEHGRISGGMAIALNITRLRQAETALLDRERMLEAIFKAEPECVKLVRADGSLLQMNPAGLAMVEADSFEQVAGLRLFTLIEPGHVDAFRHLLDRAVAGQTGTLTFEIVGLKGGRRWLETRMVPLRHPADGSAIALGLTRDITDRKSAEEALRQSERTYRNLVELLNEVIWSMDEEGRYTFVNQAVRRVYGYEPEEMVGRPFTDFVKPEIVEDDLRVFHHLLDTGEPVLHRETEHVRKDGGAIKLRCSAAVRRDAAGRSVGTTGFDTDITEVRRLEDQLRQSQKMEAIGQLAGGIAHDFNNLMTAVLGHASLLSERFGKADPACQDVEAIWTAADRAATLTRQLLAFSRRQILQPTLVNLNEITVSLEQMLRRLIGEDVELVLSLAPDLAAVKADRGQIEQVLVNLVLNARDAMPSGGKVRIETSNTSPDETRIETDHANPTGHGVRIAVTDTGIGMDKATVARIFEPFFTTKQVGEGTGLGLATVYGIVRQSGGEIAVSSVPGHGSIFSIHLPAASERARALPPSDQAPSPGGTETVLLVEDEDLVRSITARMLSARGYTVLQAGNGAQAAEIARNHPGTIDLLVTDIVMPGADGREVAVSLKAVRPRLKVLLISGYPDRATNAPCTMADRPAFLQKPYSGSTLARKVREVLDLASTPI